MNIYTSTVVKTVIIVLYGDLNIIHQSIFLQFTINYKIIKNHKLVNNDELLNITKHKVTY